MTVQTEPQTTEDVATNTTPWESEEEGSQPAFPHFQSGHSSLVHPRSELTSTDLPTGTNAILRERLRLLREEAELEEQLQEVRSAALRAKKEILIRRIQYYKNRGFMK